MPTKNRRVATYLPKEIDASFEAFKTVRGIEGDSQALIVILSEFLGVSQQVAHPLHSIEFATKQELEVLTAKVAYLVEQIQGVDGFAERATINELSELTDSSPVKVEVETEPSQPETLETETESLAAIQEDATSDEGWLSSKEAWELLQPPNCSYDAFRKYSPETLNQRFGLQCDPGRKQKGASKAKWLRMLETQHVQSELLSEPNSVLPDF